MTVQCHVTAIYFKRSKEGISKGDSELNSDTSSVDHDLLCVRESEMSSTCLEARSTIVGEGNGSMGISLIGLKKLSLVYCKFFGACVCVRVCDLYPYLTASPLSSF